MIPIDIRDFDKALYKLEIVQDNELLLHMPSLPYSIQFDSDARHAALQQLGVLCERCQEAQEICMSDIDSAPSRKQKTLRLRFPENICLANMASSINSVLPMQVQPYETRWRGKSLLTCHLSWRVASIETRRKAQGSDMKANGTILDELFGRMSTESH